MLTRMMVWFVRHWWDVEVSVGQYKASLRLAGFVRWFPIVKEESKASKIFIFH